MKPFSGSEEVPSSILSSFFRCISGNSLLRSRNTAVSLMRSMRCSELARARTSSTTASCGIAKRSPAASTIRAETMASVSGILMVTLEPSPATDLTSMVPPIWSILVRTTSMPTPRPDTEVMAGSGGEARREDELVDLGFRHLLEFGLADETVRDRLGLDPLGVETAAVVGDADQDVAAFVIGGEPDGALLGLAAGGALGRGLQAVIGGVAHHVRQRILDQVEHLAVELGVGAVHLQFDLLVQFAGEVAHDSRQLLPGIADRLHPRLHDAFLQLGGDVGQPLQRHLELGIVVAPGDLQQLIAGQHQLRHHRHQVFQRVHVDADRLVGDLVGLGHIDLDH